VDIPAQAYIFAATDWGRSTVFVIFAALTLAQIHSGKDLIDACKSSDKAACDAFIHEAIKTAATSGCTTPTYDTVKMRTIFLHGVGDPEWSGAIDRNMDAKAYFVTIMDFDCPAK
jgi:hypothetical protein